MSRLQKCTGPVQAIEKSVTVDDCGGRLQAVAAEFGEQGAKLVKRDPQPPAALRRPAGTTEVDVEVGDVERALRQPVVGLQRVVQVDLARARLIVRVKYLP